MSVIKGSAPSKEGKPYSSKGDTIQTPNVTTNTKVGSNSLPPVNPPYIGEPTYIDNSAGAEPISVLRKLMQNPDDPTTAAADLTTDLNSAIKRVDPAAISQALKSMYSLLSLVNSITQSHSNAAVNKTVTNALSGALIALSNKYGFETVLTIFDSVLSNNGINNILPQYQNMVKEALSNLVQAVIKNGSITEIPELPIPVLVYGKTVPTPLYIQEQIPDLYIQQYYTPETDPYPGYIQWLGPSGDYIYTMRTPTQYPYSSATEDIQGTAQQELVIALTPYFIVTVTPNILSVTILNTILTQSQTNTQNNGYEKSLGNNASTNIMSFLPQLLGVAGTIIKAAQSNYLPQSVLNVGSINTSLQKFSKNLAMVKQMQSISVGAFAPPSALSLLQSLTGLSGLSGLTSALGALNISVPALGAAQRVLSNIGIV